ncbi:hypothetical protein CPC08DRAFT_716291 [Agrocybe pediades]|nr:hypothetical protein CPC08DRAFT_716291 [Agrocybe pediades]
MPVTFTLPDGINYVALPLIAPMYMLVWLYIMVGKHRKLSGIKYPQMYAEQAQVEKSREALLFNCAQRCHQNTLETLPTIYVPALICATTYPRGAAVGVSLWCIGRVAYILGYMSGDPAKRVNGVPWALGQIAQMGMLLTATYLAGKWAIAGL